jgi:serine/threonine-protein kinase
MPEPELPSHSHSLRRLGLDTSNGPEFIQQRIALFAKVLVAITFAFRAVGLVLGLVFHLPLFGYSTGQQSVANLAGLVSLTLVWLIARRGRLTLRAMAALDAAALITSCTAWAFLISQPFGDSIYFAVISLIMTILARAIIVPSTATRTLLLSLAACAPTVLLMWLGLRAELLSAADPLTAFGPWLAVINQSLLLAVVVWMATIASRIIYDLRRSVREANELGQYALEEKLGAGGMGEVWRARHRFLVRAAAIKLIRADLLTKNPTGAEQLLRRFEREALATAALRSPHTVQLYDFGEAEDGTLFYVMELLLGVDLEKLVTRFGPLPAERVVYILKQVCHSLEEAHRNGLTHRDIKPANIFVSSIGSEPDFVKVLDFGLVRFHPEDGVGGDVKRTAEGRVGGTPAYIAPEIVLGEGSYDHRVDIYAVGCVAYWLLTGKLVFEGESVMKVLIAHASVEPPWPHTRTSAPIPLELEQIVMACLQKDPAQRPSSAAALAEQLSAVELVEQWTHERAEAWWREHVPDTAPERSVADVLLSHERIPNEVRELHPRRSRRGSRKPSKAPH